MMGRERGSWRQRGFTLMEMVVVTAMFALVLTAAYQILTSTLNVDERITRATQQGRIGQAILAVMRRDLHGAVYHQLGMEVFTGVDNGHGETAEDELHFLTTSPVPLAPDDMPEEYTGEVHSVGYVLQKSTEGDGLTLFRRVRWYWESEPFEGESYTPIYSRVKSLSLRYLDEFGVWQDAWDSVARFEELDALTAPQLDEDGNPIPEEDTPVDPDDPEAEEVVLPVPMPHAVEIVLEIYVGDEKGPVLNERGEPLVESYFAVEPILVVGDLDLNLFLETAGIDPMESSTGGTDGTGGTGGTGTGGTGTGAQGGQGGGSQGGGNTR